MKKYLLVLLLSLIALTGCTSAAVMPTGYNNVPPITITETQVVNTTTTEPAVTLPPVTTTATKVIDLNDTTFVYPAKMCVNLNSSRGGTTLKIQVHNGTDYDSLFDVYYDRPTEISREQVSDKFTPELKGVYEIAPKEAVKWIKVEPTKSIMSKWTENVEFTLTIPEDAIVPDKWYFYLMARDGNHGNIAAANGVTVFINMR